MGQRAAIPSLVFVGLIWSPKAVPLGSWNNYPIASALGIWNLPLCVFSLILGLFGKGNGRSLPLWRQIFGAGLEYGDSTLVNSDPDDERNGDITSTMGRPFAVAFLDYNQKVNSQSASTTSDSGLSHEWWHAAIWQYFSRVLIILLSLGAGLVNATAQSHISAYVTHLSGTVSVIDTTNNTLVATIPVGIFPSGVAITPDGTRVYVTNIFNSISVIDAATNSVVVTIPSGQFPTGIAITPDGTRAYVVNQFVTNQGNNTVSVIDTITNAIVATISVGLGPSQIAITPDGTRAYVPNQQDFIISVIDTATNTVYDHSA